MNIKEIGNYLVELRKTYKWTQERLSEYLGVSRQAVSKWETGIAIPDIEILEKLSHLYGVTINEILEADIKKISKRISKSQIEHTKSKEVVVLGCGRWGTFIGWYLNHIGYHVTIYGRKSSRHMQTLMETRKNEYLTLDPEIELTHDLDIVKKADWIVISVGTQNLSSLMNELQVYELKEKIFILCMKGIEIESGRRLSQIVDAKTDASDHTVVWLGPGHVEDFYKGIPNCMVVDGNDEMVKKEMIEALSSDLIRFYYGTDLVGNEIGAAAKNVIGIAAGMLDAVNYSSLKGPLMTRGTREIGRLIAAMGGNEQSAYGLCHLGDYQATLFSKHSHNRQFGENFVRGETYNDLAEGYYTVKALVSLAKNYGIELPICETVYRILYQGEIPKEGLNRLFERSLKEEF